MNALLEIGPSNAVLAALLAIVAAAAARLGARPAVVHGLWLVVLLKLVIPPLVSLPVTVLPAMQEVPCCESSTVVPLPGGEGSAADLPRVRGLQESPTPWPAFHWRPILFGVWLSGSACWFLMATIRVIAFHRLVRRTERAPDEWANRVRAGTRLSACGVSDVRVTDAILPPMVWAAPRRTVLLLPGSLFARLGAAEQQAATRRRAARTSAVAIITCGGWRPSFWDFSGGIPSPGLLAAASRTPPSGVATSGCSAEFAPGEQPLVREHPVCDGQLSCGIPVHLTARCRAARTHFPPVKENRDGRARSSVSSVVQDTHVSWRCSPWERH